MKRNVSTLIAVVAVTALGFSTRVHAWTGEKWGSISRATIESRALDMINLYWTPKKTIKNWEFETTYCTFEKGKTYTGVPYSQHNPQENRSEFEKLVKNTSGGKTYYGSDCSGFVSISWALPERYATTHFETDATSKGGYVSSLGDIGSGQKAGLLLGDALVKSGDHMVLFKEKLASGIKVMEQTPHNARHREWKWTALKEYRPIRRNSVK